MATLSDTLQDQTITVVEQDKYYHDSNFTLMVFIVLLSVTIVAELIVLFSFRPIVNPAPRFFQAGANGQLFQEAALDQPNMPVNALFNWVVTAMMAINTMNFVSYPAVIQKAADYFTPEGYETYKQALKDSNLLNKVYTNKYVLRATPSGPPQITKEGVLANRYLWKIEVPLQFQYKAVNLVAYDNATAVLLVMRVPIVQAPLGILILKYDLTIQDTVRPLH